MAESTRRFNWKGWISLLALLSFVIDTLSGILLYIAPAGRIANWTNWKIWGLSKEQWGAVHTIFGYVLLIIICFHIYYNWTIFWHYVWSKVKKALHLKREMAAALILSAAVFAGTLWDVPPFSSTMDLGTYLKESWEENKAEVPVAHAELQTLEAFAKTIDVPLAQVQQALKDKGYQFNSAEETLGDIAQRNNTSPDTLFEAIKAGGATPVVTKVGEGSGMGQKTVETISAELGLPVEEAIRRLEAKDASVKPGDKLKEIGSQLGLTPMEVYAIIEGK